MDISAVGDVAGISNEINSDAINNKSNISMDDFYKLLVAQLKNQDPTKPMDSTQTITQMAQVNAAEASVAMKNSIDNQTTMANIDTANSMLGKYVKYIDNESQDEKTGQVKAVDFAGGKVTMTVGSSEVKSSQVFAVADNLSALAKPPTDPAENA